MMVRQRHTLTNTTDRRRPGQRGDSLVTHQQGGRTGGRLSADFWRKRELRIDPVETFRSNAAYFLGFGFSPSDCPPALRSGPCAEERNATSAPDSSLPGAPRALCARGQATNWDLVAREQSQK